MLKTSFLAQDYHSVNICLLLNMVTGRMSLAFLLLVIVYASAQQLFEGEVCKTVSNKQWTCKRLQDCESAFQRLRDVKPQICSFKGFDLIVCCEPTTSTSNESTTPPPTRTTSKPSVPKTPRPNGVSKSAQKCEEYAQYVYGVPEQVALGFQPEPEDQCGMPTIPLIVDGIPTAPREFPHQANLGYRYRKEIKWLCTGSLISENFVLSAAHCSFSSYGPPRVAVIGDLEISTDTDDAEPEQRNIIKVINHPDYVSRVAYNDISLYKLDRNVNLNPYRHPACLNIKHNFNERSAIATGWGDTARKGTRSTQLLKVGLDIISYKNCTSFWSPGIGLREGIVEETMICAGDLHGRKDTCQGDSGGPLQVVLQEPYCMYSIIGVTSFGKECGIQTPGIYTRISHFVPWIESIVWP